MKILRTVLVTAALALAAGPSIPDSLAALFAPAPSPDSTLHRDSAVPDTSKVLDSLMASEPVSQPIADTGALNDSAGKPPVPSPDTVAPAQEVSPADTSLHHDSLAQSTPMQQHKPCTPGDRLIAIESAFPRLSVLADPAWMPDSANRLSIHVETYADTLLPWSHQNLVLRKDSLGCPYVESSPAGWKVSSRTDSLSITLRLHPPVWMVSFLSDSIPVHYTQVAGPAPLWTEATTASAAFAPGQYRIRFRPSQDTSLWSEGGFQLILDTAHSPSISVVRGGVVRIFTDTGSHVELNAFPDRQVVRATLATGTGGYRLSVRTSSGNEPSYVRDAMPDNRILPLAPNENYSLLFEKPGFQSATLQLRTGAQDTLVHIQGFERLPTLGACWRSALIPGWGQWWSDRTRTGVLFAIAAASSSAFTGLQYYNLVSSRRDFHRANQRYLDESEPLVRDQYDMERKDARDNWNSSRDLYLVGLGIIGAVWTSAILEPVVIGWFNGTASVAVQGKIP